MGWFSRSFAKRSQRPRRLENATTGKVATAPARARLFAILAADAAGFSRLMAFDDLATVRALVAARAVFRDQVAAHEGTVIDTSGDSVLAVFDSAAGAVQAAIEAQRQLGQQPANAEETPTLRFRVGLHLGDVIEQPDGTIYGDGVNIASRLQTLAEPGGIALSQSLQCLVRNRVDATFSDLGDQVLKNIAGPVHTYRLVPHIAKPRSVTQPFPRPRARTSSLTGMNLSLVAVAAAILIVLSTPLGHWSSSHTISDALVTVLRFTASRF
jgi:class 3 adenylate cyclase